ncbi:MAG: hypothetical protein M3279_06105 [Actinomycetota bacterium]|nr:hypothetical protein [Actinomycetota bacterium]
MRKMRLLTVAALMACTSLVVTARPASACTGNKVCDTINFVCQTAIGSPCLR